MIRTALEQLDSAISELESTLTEIEQSVQKGNQPDMFPDTRAAVAQSLDVMINQVENILKEAS